TDDHAQDPLLAVIAALDEALKPFTKKNSIIKKAWEATKSNGLRIASSLVVHGTKQIIKKAIGESGGEAFSEIVNAPTPKKSEALEIAEATVQATVDELVDNYSKSLIKEFNKSKSSMRSFKDNLQKLLEACGSNGKKLPLFVIVDELDRCRPTYAIHLLERIKHLFDVSNVVFIIATDTEQLCCSVNSVYGNNFDSKRYLLRFFDQSYSFAEPSLVEFVANILRIRKINTDHLEAPIGDSVPFIIEMFSAMRLSLRDIEQCLDTLENIITVWNIGCRIQLLYLVPLIVAYQQGRRDIFDMLSEFDIGDEIFDGFIPKGWRLDFEGFNFPDRQSETISVVDLLKKLCAKLKVSLPKAMESSEGQNYSQRWLRQQFQAEFASLHRSTYRVGKEPFSVMTDYPRLVQQAGRLSRD
ncbi:MAG: P-loop NTPase fold protein, partial [Rhodomicrobium sp.]